MSTYPIELRITTKHADVFHAFSDLEIDGLKSRMVLQKVWPLGQDWCYTALVNLAEGTVSGLFATWLYSVISKNADNTTNINGQELPPPTIIAPIHIEKIINIIVLQNQIEEAKVKCRDEADS